MMVESNGGPVGIRSMVRLAGKRGGAGARAVVSLRRGDVFARKTRLVGAASGLTGGVVGAVGGGTSGAALVGGVLGLVLAAVFGRLLTDRLLGKDLDQVEGATLRLPDPMLLVLDERDTVHLVGLRSNGFWLSLGAEVASWPVGEVTVTSEDPAPGSLTKPVRISFAEEVYEVVLPAQSRQRAALELIERATATAR